MTNKMPRRITSDMLFDNSFKDFFNLFDSAPAFGMNKNIPSYPHFNLTNVDENGFYTVEVALAGFDKEDISVQFEPYKENPNSGVKVLSIEAKHKEVEPNGVDETDNYIHQGIAERNAKLALLTNKNDTVEECQYKNGILHIVVKRYKPEENKNIEQIDIT